jgi:PhzF family phenazine biosynthesis protein
MNRTQTKSVDIAGTGDGANAAVLAQVQRLAAFCDIDTDRYVDGDQAGGKAIGGNPAGVWIGERLPDAGTMQRLAAAVGYSETVFAVPEADGWQVRYFSPESEVPFCGHATIALGAALARVHGNRTFPLRLLASGTRITVEGWRDGGGYGAALQSPPTRSAPAEPILIDAALALFGYTRSDLDMRIAPALVHAGAQHLVLALHSRERLRAMQYVLDAGRRLMREAGLVTIALIHARSERVFDARNPFASGGVYEDPATGAAAAACAGYLRDLGWPHGGAIEIVQGEDMGCRSRIHAEIPATPGASIRVGGKVRVLAAH